MVEVLCGVGNSEFLSCEILLLTAGSATTNWCYAAESYFLLTGRLLLPGTHRVAATVQLHLYPCSAAAVQLVGLHLDMGGVSKIG